MTRPIFRWVLGCVMAAMIGAGVGVTMTFVLTASTSRLPAIALLFCRDFPTWVEQETSDIPLGLGQADKYGEPQALWLHNDRDGYDQACGQAFERRVGEVPHRDTPQPDEPPGWHVFARRYRASGDDVATGWLVVYDGKVWRCDETSLAGAPLGAEFECRLDLGEPLPSPGTY